MTETDNLLSHLAEAGISICSKEKPEIETYPVGFLTAKSFHFDCLEFDGTKFSHILISVTRSGRVTITIRGIESMGSVSMEDMIISRDEFEGVLRKQLISYRSNEDNLR